MSEQKPNKKKIINDPVHGFITIPSQLIYDIVEHPYFQRLRRIRQSGLTSFVYPGSEHTRFQHSLGAMHLMRVTLDQLRNKGHQISAEEYEAALIAILLHDVGHGPFSHTLETAILQDAPHEELSLLIMQSLNQHFGGRLELAIQIFKDQYARRFFHQLVSSQLDIDRLDYLQRDCFFTGVIEGKVGFDRIIRMMDIVDDSIVVEEKGVYSVENFLNARRLMYWQVYLHKTTLSTEQMMIQVVRRARALALKGEEVFATPALRTFLYNHVTLADFATDPVYLRKYSRLDDFDIWASIKMWTDHEDLLLSMLSKMLLSRNLFRIHLSATPFEQSTVEAIRQKAMVHFNLSEEDAGYIFSTGQVSNAGYVPHDKSILIKTKDGRVVDISEVSDLVNIEALSKIVKKFYLCYPKVLSL